MGSSKATHQPRHPGVYRDEPDRDDASTSSAVLLEDIDEPTYPDEELPAYTDHPTSSLVPGLDTSSGPRDPLHYHYECVVFPNPLSILFFSFFAPPC